MDGRDIQFADTLPPPEYVKAPTWTFEQQVQELKRRMMWVHIAIDYIRRDWKRITWAIHCYRPIRGPSSLEWMTPLIR